MTKLTTITTFQEGNLIDEIQQTEHSFADEEKARQERISKSILQLFRQLPTNRQQALLEKLAIDFDLEKEDDA